MVFGLVDDVVMITLFYLSHHAKHIMRYVSNIH